MNKPLKRLLAAGGITSIAVVISLLGNNGDIENNEIVLANKTIFEKQAIRDAELKNAQIGEELITRRTEYTKKFKAGKNKYKMILYTTKQHYYDTDTGIYKEYDTTVKEIDKKAKKNESRKHDKYVDPGRDAPKTTWFENEPWNYTFMDSSGEYYVSYEALFNTDDVEISFEYQNFETKEFITINDIGDSNELSWKIETNADYELVNDEIRFTDDKNNFLFRTTSPWARDADLRYININVELNGDTLTYKLDIPESVTYPIRIDPSTTVDDVDAATGTLAKTNFPTWASVRDTTSSETASYNVAVGYVSNITEDDFQLWRSLLRFDTNSLPDSAYIDSAKVKLVSNVDATDVTNAFYAVMVQASASLNQSEFVCDNYNDFTGWESSGTYSVINVSDSLELDNTISEGDTLTYTFNSNGYNIIDLSDTTQFYLLSKADIFDITPGSNINTYIVCNDDNPYMQIWYTVETFYAPTVTVTNVDTNYVKLVLDAGSNPDSAHFGIRLRDETNNTFYWDGSDTTDIEFSKTATAWGDTININSGLQKDHNYWIDVLVRSNAKGAWLECTRSGARTASPDVHTFISPHHFEGYIFSTQSSSAAYDGAGGARRMNHVEGDSTLFKAQEAFIGQQEMFAASLYTVFRTYICFDDPTMVDATHGELIADILADNSDMDFQIDIIESSWVLADSPYVSTHWSFDGWHDADTPFTGTQLAETNTTNGIGDSLRLTLTSYGVSRVNTMFASPLNAWDIELISDEDQTGDPPANDTDEYIELNSSLSSCYLNMWYAKPDVHSATAPTITSISPDSMKVEWADSSINNVAFLITDGSGNILSDTLAHNATCDTLTGIFLPNTQYTFKVKNIGGLYDGYFTSTASAYTKAALPSITVYSLEDSTISVYIDTTGTGNPASTEYALRDSNSGLFIQPITGRLDSIVSTVNWFNITTHRADGDTAKVRLIYGDPDSSLIGTTLTIQINARTDG